MGTDATSQHHFDPLWCFGMTKQSLKMHPDQICFGLFFIPNCFWLWLGFGSHLRAQPKQGRQRRTGVCARGGRGGFAHRRCIVYTGRLRESCVVYGACARGTIGSCTWTSSSSGPDGVHPRPSTITRLHKTPALTETAAAGHGSTSACKGSAHTGTASLKKRHICNQMKAHAMSRRAV